MRHYYIIYISYFYGLGSKLDEARTTHALLSRVYSVVVVAVVFGLCFCTLSLFC